ncbi:MULTISPECIES: isochorismatase family protein [Prochlorococcus]|uniref:Isochorismatase family hydrolase n=2 Tax=Prochlorococcaceae TaxID=2881426 RepID=Q7VCE7_PROMA|nr:isochorismatase family protein [Prochlorococcus marinus]AAP99837.1 Isochorismatase family hydrolase [Prochlorococcus marinus subsp. marinus str. CCMP1375]
MNPSETALIVIDVQERLTKAIPENADLLVNIKKLIEGFKILDINIFFTEQNPTKLGVTLEEITRGLEVIKFSKMDFSVLGCNDLLKSIKKKKIQHLIICGIETHVCVLQSSLDLAKAGFNIHVIADATKSRNLLDQEIALLRLRQFGIQISTVETTIFELCRTSKSNKFKAISKLIKNSNPSKI